MSWYKKLLNIAKDVAPTVTGGAATALTGGNIALGGVVSSIVGSLIGQASPDLEKASQTILGDPQLTMEFRSRMKDAEIRELEIRAKDTQSARNTLKYSKGPVLISALTTVAFATLLFLVMFVAIPPSSQAVAYLLMGSIATAFTQVLNFWLGTSVGSKEKDDTIKRFASAAERDQNRRNNGN